MKPGSMREAMPSVAQFVDSMRDTFCDTQAERDQFNQAMIRGIRGDRDQFHAREGSVEVGTKFRKVWLAPYHGPVAPRAGTRSKDRP